MRHDGGDPVLLPGGVRRDHAVLALATAAAFASAMAAVSGHVESLEAGYRLAAARREGEVLRREVLNAERRVATLRLPPAVAARAGQIHHLALLHPRDRKVFTPEQVVAAVSAAAPSVPVAGPAPGEVMAR